MISVNTKDPETARLPLVDITASHLKWDVDRQSIAALLNQATRLRDEARRKRPFVLSGDGAGHLWPKLVKRLQNKLRRGGRNHLEQYDRAFNNNIGMQGAATKPEHYSAGVRRRMKQLGRRATLLAPGGVLTRKSTRRGGRLLWNGHRANLMGWSFMGMLSTTRHDLELFFDVLSRYGVNLTRVWAIEQWTGTGLGNGDLWKTGLCPFAGNIKDGYDLHSYSVEWFDRFTNFVKLADQHGVVVQFTLFDRAGLRMARKGKPTGVGMWRSSPYNVANNNGQLDLVIPSDRDYPSRFTSAVDASDVNEALIRQIVGSVCGLEDGNRLASNLIWEIGNEWYPERIFADMHSWTRWVSEVINDEMARHDETEKPF